MATLQQIMSLADAKIDLLVQQVEAKKLQDGVYSYTPRKADGDVEILINTATDKDGNFGYYIAVFAEYQGIQYQKIVRKGADEDDSKDWFIVANYV